MKKFLEGLAGAGIITFFVGAACADSEELVYPILIIVIGIAMMIGAAMGLSDIEKKH